MKEWKLPDLEEEERNHALLPRLQEAVEMMLRDAAATKATEADSSSASDHLLQPNGEGVLGSGRGNNELSVGENASQEIGVKLRGWVVVEDDVEAAALDNRNFIRVMVGDESYLALLDPGATISVVGSRILNKYRSRLQESSGQVRGMCLESR